MISQSLQTKFLFKKKKSQNKLLCCLAYSVCAPIAQKDESLAADRRDRKLTVAAAPESSTDIPEQHDKEALTSQHSYIGSQHTNAAGLNSKTHSDSHSYCSEAHTQTHIVHAVVSAVE